MKQFKGKGCAKASRQWTDTNRKAKNRLEKNIKAAEARGELDEEKIVPSTPIKEDDRREKQVKPDTVEISTKKGMRYLKQEGSYIYVYYDNEGKRDLEYKINIPLFCKIACFTSVRRSYKNVMREFFDQLKKENIPFFFTTREDLERATQGCGRPGGKIAYLLGLFCRYYSKHPRNVNVVWQCCEDCNSIARCGKEEKCGDYYGCGGGVIIPLDPAFRIDTIPGIRAAIKTEIFPCPEGE